MTAAGVPVYCFTLPSLHKIDTYYTYKGTGKSQLLQRLLELLVVLLQGTGKNWPNS